MSLEPIAIHHVSVLSTDFERSEAFYGSTLGLEKISRPATFNFQGRWFQLGHVQVHLMPSDTPDTECMRHFAITVADAQSARRHLSERGCDIEETDSAGLFPDVPDMDRFFTRDPDGNRIEVIEYLNR